MDRGGLWPAGHASRRDAGDCSGSNGTTAAVATEKGAHEGRQMTAKVVVHSVGLEKARRWKNDSGEGGSAMAAASGKQRGGEKETNGDSQAIKDGQEARGSHAAALSTPARHRNWTRTRLEDDRSSPSVSWLPRVLFTDITELPLAKFSKLLPNFHNNSKISKNKSCSKFKVLQLCFYNHSLIRSSF